MGKKKHRMYTVRNESDYCREDEEDNAGLDSIAFTRFHIQKLFKKFDKHQMNYVTSIGPKRVVMTDSPSGTGKTQGAVARALQMLDNGEIKRIQYVRFPDKRTMKLGALPGSLAEKESKYFEPFFEAALECGLTKEQVYRLIGNEIIELSTDVFLRGRTLAETFLIADESQNGEIDDLRLTFTRLKEEGYGVFIGHSGQMDNPKLAKYGPKNLNPFQVYQIHMDKKDFTKICPLVNDYRGEISRWADNVEETIRELLG